MFKLARKNKKLIAGSLVVTLVAYYLYSRVLPYHQTIGTEFSPVSGSEPVYNPDEWNFQPKQKNNNCYAYSINHGRKDRMNRLQPGLLVNPQDKEYHGKPHSDVTNCTALTKRVLEDFPEAKVVEYGDRCPTGTYKVLLTTHDKSGDYHWFRQDNTGLWSHKPGSNKATNRDHDGRIIVDPRVANRYSRTHGRPAYLCNFICVPANSPYKD